MELVRTKTYERGLKRLAKLGATEDDFRTMENAIALMPEAGDVIPGSGGLRKARFAYGDKGKSGGGRTIYYVVRGERAFLMTAYAKVDQENVEPDVLKQLKAKAKEADNG